VPVLAIPTWIRRETGDPSSEEEDMKSVLMALAIVLAVIVAVTLDCPYASASFAENAGSRSGEVLQPPQDTEGSSGVCGGDGTAGDPDDLGGGFRTTAKQAGQPVGGTKLPTTTAVSLMLTVQRIWMSILR